MYPDSVLREQCQHKAPPEMIVERVSGDAPESYFLGPSWCLDKPAVLLALQAELERRDTWQGRLFQA